MKVTAVELTGIEILDIKERVKQACKNRINSKVDITDENDDLVSLSIYHDEGQDILDTEAIKRGVCLALTKSEYVAKQTARYQELGFIDSLAVDLIVQYGLFGKLVYG